MDPTQILIDLLKISPALALAVWMLKCQRDERKEAIDAVDKREQQHIALQNRANEIIEKCAINYALQLDKYNTLVAEIKNWAEEVRDLTAEVKALKGRNQ